jgi:hypothetical protein
MSNDLRSVVDPASNRLSAHLYELLPAIYRVRDDEQVRPLQALLDVIAEQVAVLEEDLAQLYDDQFIETCAPWVVPYIGDLVGARGINDPRGESAAFSERALVADTIRLRRRKGTAAVLEQLAHDVTNWEARVVEFFRFLATTQYLKRLRPQNRAFADLRDVAALEALDSPFDTLAHTVDVRRIASGRGRYNLPNVGVFLWRLQAYRLTDAPATLVANRRYLFGPAGGIVPLFNQPDTESGISHLAERGNVPMPLSRRLLDRDLDRYYGPDNSISITIDGTPIPREQISVCDLSDLGTGWAHRPTRTYGIDPELGRLALRTDRPVPNDVRVTFHYGAPMDLGGGEYERESTLDVERTPVVVPNRDQTGPNADTARRDALQQALDQVADGGAVEIRANDRYRGTLTIQPGSEAGPEIELRAADGCWPILDLDAGDLTITGDRATITLNGLLIVGGLIRVRATGSGAVVERLRLRHCTLVPGRRQRPNGDPTVAGAVTLIVESPGTAVEIDHCIVGGIRTVDGVTVSITDSIVDATAPNRIAYAAPNNSPGGALTVQESTIIGKVSTMALDLASNSIFLAERTATDPPTTPPVRAERLQQGCVRFCFLPIDARVPRRHASQPADAAAAARIGPIFAALRYGDPDYCRLSQRTPPEISQGADDGSEMGVFHDLFQPQRETNVRIRLDEFLRFNLEAGIFYVT